MSGFAPFRLNRSAALLALISAAFAGEALAAAARVDFSTAGVTVAGRDGRVRAVKKGVELDNGDTLRTNNGRAQLRFTDGSYVSLQPNTEFGIADYRYEGRNDGSERSFLTLLKGAMRTVTGAVGKANRNAYRLSTPTATVGIRGTGGVIQVRPDGSTLVIGTSGLWSLTNAAGTIDVPAGVAALAPAEPKAPPRETSHQPAADPAPLPPAKKADLVQGDQVTTGGLPKGIVLATGGGYSSAFAYTSTSVTGAAPVAALTPGVKVDAVFDELGHLQKAAVGNGFAIDAGKHAPESNTDGILAWGRWIGPVVVNGVAESYFDTQGMHYVIGIPTPVLPTSGTGVYTVIGATQPTQADGKMGPAKFDGTLNVTFGALATIDGKFSVSMLDGTAYTWTGRATTSSAPFSMTSTFSGINDPSSACRSSCTASVSGFFAGPNAERAGIGYQVQDPIASRTVLGAAAFAKQ